QTLVGRMIAAMANIYFRLGELPIAFCRDEKAWQQWEVECFRMINEGFDAFPFGGRAVCTSKVPGENLWVHLRKGTLKVGMVEAAARELRRAHSLTSRTLNAPWSHGDACMENFIYDPRTDRARIIDFDIMHAGSIPGEDRHAEDLMTF